MAGKPRVSVIVAAYNRAEVLRHALRSVLSSDFTDFEVLVVGDGCTDHSCEVVSAFDDARLSFEDLGSNSGGQAAPNNHALQKTRGDVIFFLNQDDLYLTSHISASLAFLQNSDADLVWCPVVLIEQLLSAAGPADPARDRIS
ncbi:MAG: glycosyltransferase family A protein, partial [Pseudomonadota bacterium]